MSALAGTLRYEALVAARQRTLWFVLVPLAAFSVLVALTSPSIADDGGGVRRVGAAVTVAGLLCTPGIAVALAGRLSGQTPGFRDLLETLPAGRVARLLGTGLGPILVAIAPIGAALLVIGAVGAADTGSAAPVGAAVLGTVLLLPGVWSLCAFTWLLATLVPLAVARVVAVGAWAWATLASPELSPVPTITGTVLSPLPGYPLVSWLDQSTVWAARGGDGPLRPDAGDAMAVVNVVAVLAAGTLLLIAARLVLAHRAGRPSGGGTPA